MKKLLSLCLIASVVGCQSMGKDRPALSDNHGSEKHYTETDQWPIKVRTYDRGHEPKTVMDAESWPFRRVVEETEEQASEKPTTRGQQPEMPSANMTTTGVARVNRVSQAQFEAPNPNRRVPLSVPPNPNPQVFPDARPVTFSPSDPRLVLTAQGKVIGGEQTLKRTARDHEDLVGRPADLHPDEYIFDGGDRANPVHFGDFTREGLDTEDTIAEFVDSNGKFKVKKTNRVAIYAPRFASVRTEVAPNGDISIAKLSGFQDAAYDSGLKGRRGPDVFEHKDRLRRFDTRSRASGVLNKTRQTGVENTRRLTAHTKWLNVYENNAFVQRGEFNSGEEARLAFGLKAAMKWTREQNPTLAAQIDSTHQVEARFKAMEMVGVDLKHLKDGKLRIVKLADKLSAKPGDVITFVIRYDNLGDKPLHHIKIVDNLTPRLEFIEESAESDRAGDVIMEDNAEGSLVLTFKLDDALPAKTGGVVSFQCRVR